MIGYVKGKFIGSDDGSALVDTGGVGYSLNIPASVLDRLSMGQEVEFYVHTHLRENALELFGFSNLWEKNVFNLLTSVSGIGPKTALSMMSKIKSSELLAALVREDRITLSHVPGVGKKTVERLLLELSEKARKLLSERPRSGEAQETVIMAAPSLEQKIEEEKTEKKRKKSSSIPPQGASANDPTSSKSSVDLADIWNEALEALQQLGYRDVEAIAAIRAATQSLGEEQVSIEGLVKTSLQLLSKGILR